MSKDTKELFDQAEQERISGSIDKAIELYRQVADHPSEYQAQAQHMLGVSLRVAGKQGESQAILKQLLDQDLPALERAHILRDYGDSLRVAEQYSEAQEALDESLQLFDSNNGSSDERAATVGFLARLQYQQGDPELATTTAEQAAALFAEGENKHAEFYHNIFRARLLALTGRANEAKKMARSLSDDAVRYGNSKHVERLHIIEQHADEPEVMESAIKNSRGSSMA